MNKSTIILIIVLLLIAAGAGVLADKLSAYRPNAIEAPSHGLSEGVAQPISPEDLGNDPAIPRTVTLQGSLVCLPHRDMSGPQTLECAFGFKADGGDHYAMSASDLPVDFLNSVQTGERIEVTGLMVPIEAISTDMWQKYDIRGIIQVSAAQKI